MSETVTQAADRTTGTDDLAERKQRERERAIELHQAERERIARLHGWNDDEF